ncbi:MAG: tetratricopeptide repeat protein [Alphaproteobacteria bacterium]|nr:tetratricopeptide repeat protein [Alphaproteobacteria bacterium]
MNRRERRAREAQKGAAPAPQRRPTEAASRPSIAAAPVEAISAALGNGRRDEAVARLRALLEAPPVAAETDFRLGNLANQAGDRALAAALFERARRARPDQPVILVNLASASRSDATPRPRLRAARPSRSHPRCPNPT